MLNFLNLKSFFIHLFFWVASSLSTLWVKQINSKLLLLCNCPKDGRAFSFFSRPLLLLQGCRNVLKSGWGGEKNGSFVGGIICPPVALGLTTLPKYKGACIPPAPRFRHLCAFWLLAELNWTIESDSYNPFYFTRKILVCSVYGTHWMTSDIKDFPCIFPDNFVNAYLSWN